MLSAGLTLVGAGMVGLPLSDSPPALTACAFLVFAALACCNTGAEIVVAGDYSCLMNIGGGLARSGSGIRSMHLAEVLAGTEESPWFAPATNTKVGA